MSDTSRTDLSHLPPSTPEEIRAMTRRAGLDLPERADAPVHRGMAELRGDGAPDPAEPRLRRGAGPHLPPDAAFVGSGSADDQHVAGEALDVSAKLAGAALDHERPRPPAPGSRVRRCAGAALPRLPARPRPASLPGSRPVAQPATRGSRSIGAGRADKPRPTRRCRPRPPALRCRAAAPEFGPLSRNSTITGPRPSNSRRASRNRAENRRSRTTSGIRPGNDRRSADPARRRRRGHVPKMPDSAASGPPRTISNEASTPVPPSRRDEFAAGSLGRGLQVQFGVFHRERLHPDARRKLAGERQGGDMQQLFVLDKDAVQRCFGAGGEAGRGLDRCEALRGCVERHDDPLDAAAHARLPSMATRASSAAAAAKASSRAAMRWFKLPAG